MVATGMTMRLTVAIMPLTMPMPYMLAAWSLESGRWSCEASRIDCNGFHVSDNDGGGEALHQ
jgi:hypothetical protein